MEPKTSLAAEIADVSKFDCEEQMGPNPVFHPDIIFI